MNGFSKRHVKEKVSVGILGTGRGCGATHLVLAAANYLQSVIGRQTAVIELSGRNELQEMVRRERGESQDLLGIRYYTGKSARQLPEIYSQGYEAYILDLGTDYPTARAEFLRCDRQIIIGSISPWKAAEYESFVNKVNNQAMRKWEFLALYANKHDRRKLEKDYMIHIVPVPFMENPFCLQRKDMAFLQTIL